MRKIRDFINRILFPKRCGFCGRSIAESSELHICDACLATLPVIRGGGKLRLKGHLDFVISPFGYTDGVRQCIHLMKFKNKPMLARTLAAFMAERLAATCDLADFDMVIPVPMSWIERMRRENSNAAEWLAEEIARRCNLTYADNCLYKIRHTRAQSSLHSYNERVLNVRDAFVCNKPLDDLRILLVDDVFTTGATLKNCAKALKVAGAERICALTAARSGANVQKKSIGFQVVGDMVFRKKSIGK